MLGASTPTDEECGEWIGCVLPTAHSVVGIVVFSYTHRGGRSNCNGFNVGQVSIGSPCCSKHPQVRLEEILTNDDAKDKTVFSTSERNPRVRASGIFTIDLRGSLLVTEDYHLFPPIRRPNMHSCLFSPRHTFTYKRIRKPAEHAIFVWR